MRTYLRLAFVTGALATVLSVSQAAPLTYSCTSGCNGNEYALWLVSNVGTTYLFELDIHVLSGYTGNQWTDKIGAVQLKTLGTGISNATLVSAPGSPGDWNLWPNELAANGCDGGSSGNLRLCAEAASFAQAASFTSGDTLKWRFQFDAISLSGTAELKYLYASAASPDGNAPGFLNWDSVGSLGSWDIALQRDVTAPDEPNGNGTPEPSTWALAAGGLALLVFARRSGR